jgi:hypothetical protein
MIIKRQKVEGRLWVIYPVDEDEYPSYWSFHLNGCMLTFPRTRKTFLTVFKQTYLTWRTDPLVAE